MKDHNRSKVQLLRTILAVDALGVAIPPSAGGLWDWLFFEPFPIALEVVLFDIG